MIRWGWKEKRHAFAAGRELETGYQSEEGFVTQLLEMGIYETIADFDHLIHDVYLRC